MPPQRCASPITLATLEHTTTSNFPLLPQASPQEALEEIKTVTVAAAEDAESWETEPALVGLESGTPEVVALAELVNQKVEAAVSHPSRHSGGLFKGGSSIRCPA